MKETPQCMNELKCKVSQSYFLILVLFTGSSLSKWFNLFFSAFILLRYFTIILQFLQMFDRHVMSMKREIVLSDPSLKIKFGSTLY